MKSIKYINKKTLTSLSANNLELFIHILIHNCLSPVSLTTKANIGLANVIEIDPLSQGQISAQFKMEFCIMKIVGFNRLFTVNLFYS